MTHAHLIRLLLLALIACALPACVERQITIATDPPGCQVWVNDVELNNRSPVTFPFLWYGDYDIRIKLDRVEGAGPDAKVVHYYLHTHRKTEVPPFQWLGVDLFVEITPGKFKDEKLWAFVVPPVPDPSDEELVKRAKELQSQLNTPVPLKDKK